ncbi:TPA: HNH endonuclease [Yersinia enterocolitica]|nr:HNH endonuclease [Yersinia enterocolitica]HDL6705412.1 HNH endonuclease [Yersinia enterocolitica]HEN3234649.1 HNH endonuclease [Yersinia enterocolitica]HEN3330106.1 HNH endonuclease [Yersinia enterocolitica]HEN3408305.1 HNH endonuclease [Yersinia enterocolitica]
MYLSKISPELGHLLLKLCHSDSLIQQNDTSDYQEIEKDIAEIKAHKLGDPTTAERLIQARVGQGLFRENVLALYPQCPVTGVSMPELLRASHIKPWRDSSDEERLDPYNGLMLAPHVDVLFDKGYISFTDGGDIIIKDEQQVREVVKKFNIDENIKVNLNKKTRFYLSWHRNRIFGLI